MGPRSSDRGYAWRFDKLNKKIYKLQWVHGPQTVVMHVLFPYQEVPTLSASMGPRSSDRGYALQDTTTTVSPFVLQWVHGPQTVVMNLGSRNRLPNGKLQWVHGPQTVVMNGTGSGSYHGEHASMGPRSSDRGYGPRRGS